MAAPGPALASPRSNVLVEELETIWRHRQLIAALTSRDLKARYRGSVLGFFWSLANPLLLLGVYTLIFGHFFTRPGGVDPYSVFLFTGILPWTFFAGAILESTTAVAGNAGLIKKVMFPAEALPLVVVLSHLVHFLLALPILFVALGVAGFLGKITFGWPLLLVPVLMLLQTMLVAGISLVVASASVLFRDLRDLVANLMQLAFFLTPIIYYLGDIGSPTLRSLLRVNPMTSFAIGYQDVFFFARWPNGLDMSLMVIWAFAFLALGFVVFDRLRDTLAEAI